MSVTKGPCRESNSQPSDYETRLLPFGHEVRILFGKILSGICSGTCHVNIHINFNYNFQETNRNCSVPINKYFHFQKNDKQLSRYM
jgi:hypothetical protein